MEHVELLLDDCGSQELASWSGAITLLPITGTACSKCQAIGYT